MLSIPQNTPENLYQNHTRLVGPNKDKCHYLWGLYATLVKFRPKYCLEIGTHKGNTAKVFQKYFDKYETNGMLVTCDIKKYVDLSDLKNVKQLIVSHHSDEVHKLHNVDRNLLKYSYVDSVKTNIQLLKNEFEMYDFAFIDGDHTRDSFLKDIQISESVLKEPKLMLLDDTKEPVHECMKIYNEEIKPKYESYDFQDWSVFVGCSLIRAQ